MNTCIHGIGGQGQHPQKAKSILCSLTRQRALFLLFGVIVESINLQVEYRNLQSCSRFPQNLLIEIRRLSAHLPVELYAVGLSQRQAPLIFHRIQKPVAHGTHPWPMTCGSCAMRSEEHTSELQSRGHLVCRL